MLLIKLKYTVQLVECLLSPFSSIISSSIFFLLFAILFLPKNKKLIGFLSHRFSHSLDLAEWTPWCHLTCCSIPCISCHCWEWKLPQSQILYFWQNYFSSNPPNLSGLLGLTLFILPQVCRSALLSSRLCITSRFPDTSFHLLTLALRMRKQPLPDADAHCFHGKGQKLKKGGAKSHICFCLGIAYVRFAHIPLFKGSLMAKLKVSGAFQEITTSLEKKWIITNKSMFQSLFCLILFVCSLEMLESLNHKSYKMVPF